MNNFADVVEVVEPDEALSCDLPCQVDGHSLELILFDDIEQVHAEDFEDEAKMLAIWGSVYESVQ